MRISFSTTLMVCLTFVTLGCNDDQASVSLPESAKPLAVDATPYLVTTEPADTTPVGEARESLMDGESATLIGTIGGSSKPFIEGLAAFTIVDQKIPCCAAEEGCPTPWDYCCTQDQVKDNIATIKIVDESGSPVTADARQLFGISELSQVIVSGTAKRDDQGNLTLAASTIYVKP
ncbi:MAG: hypothetical protein P8L85_08015 [Rubripirellula sp.]|nr:hypothetical protein [Rubripirellula sp.]